MLYTDPSAFSSRSYDYVIIGGGLVGLVIAARLSEDPNIHVAVLEAGGYATGDSRVAVPAYFWKTHGDPEFDWLLKTSPQSSVNGRRVPLPRGKTLGGTSVINTMTWFRGVREDYDALVELGNPGWGWNDWVPYFCKSETAHSPLNKEWANKNAATVEPGLSGTTGPLQRCFAQWLGDTHIPFLKSFENIGVKPNPEANMGYNIGTFTVTTTVDPKTSQRSSSTTAYFEPNSGRRNLHVLTSATVNRVLLRPSGPIGQYHATGVEFIHSRRSYQVGAVKEVVVCAGAYLSPTILERSGIGCPKRLRSLGIPNLIDLPGVGENLQDHVLVPTSFELKDKNTVTGDLLRNPEFITQELERYQCEGGGMLASIHSAFSMIPLQNFTTDHMMSKLDTMLHQLEKDASTPGQRKILKIQREWLQDPRRGQLEIMHVPEFCTFGASRPAENGRYVSFLNVLMQPVSRGSVHVSSSDPRRAPVIDPRYYHDRFDLEMMIAGLKYTHKLANTEPLASMIRQPIDPRPDQMGERELEEYAKSLLESAHHPIGSNSMMPREDGGVVDPKLKVYGVDNLRIADGSIFPLSMSCHPQATLYALGEKASEMIKEDFYHLPKL